MSKSSKKIDLLRKDLIEVLEVIGERLKAIEGKVNAIVPDKQELTARLQEEAGFALPQGRGGRIK